MKKELLILLMLFVGMLSMSGQTYCYKHLYNVDTNGVRQKVKTHYIYITFVNNFSTCYMSDQYGNAENGDGLVTQYKGKDGNGTLIYETPIQEFGMGLSNRGMRTTRYFSSDLSRMNFKNELVPLTGVYERVSAPQDEEAPVELY